MKVTSAPSIFSGGQAKQAFMTIKVEDLKDAADKTNSLALKNSWTVSEVPEATDDGGRDIIINIPAAQFDRAAAELGKIGVVTANEYPDRARTGSGTEEPAAEPGMTRRIRSGRGRTRYLCGSGWSNCLS
jgi:hypothetical protein